MIINNLFGYDEYLKLLQSICSLSKLFSDNTVPYLYYRNAENLFCYALNAKNLSRDDSAFDALLSINSEHIGVGLKTFICQGNSSVEKVAEFNQISHSLREMKGKELVLAIANARNERIKMAHRLYGVDSAIYHLVTRKENELRLFEEDYIPIDVENIKNIKESKSGIHFFDGNYEYSFNFSKSTLFKRFYVPNNYKSVSVQILDEPYKWLSEIMADFSKAKEIKAQKEFIILPLYSTKTGNVEAHSGLNQWNAGGRLRDFGEVYIPVPKFIHNCYEGFFPNQNTTFKLKVPDGQEFEAKICQQGGKALMTNPNSALSNWLLRTLLNLKEGELATTEHLKLVDCDSVKITKLSEGVYSIDKAKFGSYDLFSKNLYIAE